MEIILLQDVKALGKKGEKVNVSEGYARNFILPKKLGIEVNAKNMNDLKLQKALSGDFFRHKLRLCKVRRIFVSAGYCKGVLRCGMIYT